MGASGLTAFTPFLNRFMSKSITGSGVDLIEHHGSGAENMPGYLYGLSSPSGTDATTNLCLLPQIEAGRADKIATFSMKRSARV